MAILVKHLVAVVCAIGLVLGFVSYRSSLKHMQDKLDDAHDYYSRELKDAETKYEAIEQLLVSTETECKNTNKAHTQRLEILDEQVENEKKIAQKLVATCKQEMENVVLELETSKSQHAASLSTIEKLKEEKEGLVADEASNKKCEEDLEKLKSELAIAKTEIATLSTKEAGLIEKIELLEKEKSKFLDEKAQMKDIIDSTQKIMKGDDNKEESEKKEEPAAVLVDNPDKADNGANNSADTKKDEEVTQEKENENKEDVNEENEDKDNEVEENADVQDAEEQEQDADNEEENKTDSGDEQEKQQQIETNEHMPPAGPLV